MPDCAVCGHEATNTKGGNLWLCDEHSHLRGRLILVGALAIALVAGVLWLLTELLV